MDRPDPIEQIKKEFPHIRPFEEDDLEWWNEGLDRINAGDLDQAEEIFKKLTLSQPNHSDGFEGLAKVYTQKADRPQAEFFLREAIRRAELMVKDGSMDPTLLEKLRTDLDRLLQS